MDRRDLRVIAHGVCVARYYILRIRPGWVATPSPDTPGHSALRSLSEATNCEQPRARTKLGVLFCDDSRRVSIKYCCSRPCLTAASRRRGLSKKPPLASNGQALAYVYYEEEPGATIGGQTAFARRGAADRGKLLPSCRSCCGSEGTQAPKPLGHRCKDSLGQSQPGRRYRGRMGAKAGSIRFLLELCRGCALTLVASFTMRELLSLVPRPFPAILAPLSSPIWHSGTRRICST